MATATRLYKLASQINIGKDRIVEHLVSKGFEVDNKPMAKLSNEMVDVVLEHFKREVAAAIKLEEKFEAHRKARQSSEPKEDGAAVQDEPTAEAPAVETAEAEAREQRSG